MFPLLNKQKPLRRVCHINLAKSYRGGERQTELLVLESCDRFGVEGVVVVVRYGGTLSRKFKRISGLTVLEARHQLDAHLRAWLENIAICHAHEAKAVHWAFLHFRLTGVPYIITRRVQNPIGRNSFVNSCYQSAQHVIAISSAIQAELAKTNVRSRIIRSVSPNHNPRPQNSPPVAVSRRGSPSKSIKILMAGALDTAQKGHLVALDALALLDKRWSLLFFGDGPDEQMLRESVDRLSLSDRVVFESWDDQLIIDRLVESDFFLMPSLHEGLGSILLDAMRARIPVVASNVGGIPDFVKHEQTGLLVSPNVAAEIVEALNRLCVDPGLANQLVDTAFTFSEAYTPHRMFDEYLILYR